MKTQDGYDWPNPHPEQPDLLAFTEDGSAVILSSPEAWLVDSGMTFRGVPVLWDARFSAQDVEKTSG
jgi:hypothetical protein